MNNHSKKKLKKNNKIVFFLIFVASIIILENIIPDNIFGSLFLFMFFTWIGIFIYTNFIIDYNFVTLERRQYFFFKGINLLFIILFFYGSISSFFYEFKIKNFNGIEDRFVVIFFLFCSLLLHFFLTVRKKIFLASLFLKYFFITFIFYVVFTLGGYMTKIENFIILFLPIKISTNSLSSIINFYVFLTIYICYILLLWNINCVRYKSKFSNYLKICISIFNIIGICLPIKLLYIAIFEPKIYLSKDINTIKNFFFFYIFIISIIAIFQIYILFFHDKVLKKILTKQNLKISE